MLGPEGAPYRQIVALEPLPGYRLQIARDLWRLKDAPARTLGAVRKPTPTQLGADNGVGTALYLTFA